MRRRSPFPTAWSLLLAALAIAASASARPRPTREQTKGEKHAQKGGSSEPAGKSATASSKDPSAPQPVKPRPADVTTAPAAPAPLTLTVQRATLENGLRVVMNVDRTSPTVAVAMTYDVGGRNEERGRSGFAHLFEHMMFEGSANVPKGEHFRLVSGHGGNLNGTTSSDRTNYFEMLPSSELALALWLEADRMKSLDVSAENFENQRKVVQEEYRMRVSNVAYAPAQIRLSELAFQGYWPYEHDPIGSMQDLDNAQIDWVRAFHESYYAPNLAVLTIAGDFEPDEAMQLVHRFFDTAKKQDKVIAYEPPPLPETAGPRTASLEDEHAKTPGFFYGWVIPASREADHYALELANGILADGESSRLYQKLVRDRALAQEVSGSTEDHRGPDLLAFEVKLADGARLSDTEKAVDGQLEALARNGPTDAEMAKVRNRIEASFLFGLQSNLQRAIKLGQYELFWGDARLISGEPAKYFAVSKEDIKRVTAQYLVPAHRVAVEVRPTGMTESPPRPAPARATPPPQKGGKNGTKIKHGLALGKEREGGLHKSKRKKETQ
jgi:zinc protease